MPPIRETWELADLVSEQAFKTDATGQATIPVALEAGIYRAMLQTQDRFGKAVTAQQTIQVVDPQADALRRADRQSLRGPELVRRAGRDVHRPSGAPATTPAGPMWSSNAAARSCGPGGRTRPDAGGHQRGGHRGHARRIHAPRHLRPREPGLFNEQIVDVPWTNKQLTIAWEHFRSLLEPGQKETWTAIITGPDARKAVAEMVAGLYDASLDQYLPHDWLHSFTGFRQESSRLSSRFENSVGLVRMRSIRLVSRTTDR